MKHDFFQIAQLMTKLHILRYLLRDLLAASAPRTCGRTYLHCDAATARHRRVSPADDTHWEFPPRACETRAILPRYDVPTACL